MVSIVIAAHNEESVLGDTLDALLDDDVDAQIIVVPNGCTDGTADVARARRGVEVVEVEQGSKPVALNAGDAVARSATRIYLDADIVVPRGGVAALAEALERPGIVAAVPGRELRTAGLPWPVRAHSAIHQRLPVFKEGLFGRGMIALSPEGRARFGSFPIMVADDLFLDSLFAPEEKAHVDSVRVVVEPPPTTRELMNRLVRVRRGSAAMRRAAERGEVSVAVRPGDRWAWLRDVVLKEPRLAPAGVVYAAMMAIVGLRSRRGPEDAMDWGRKAQRASAVGRRSAGD